MCTENIKQEEFSKKAVRHFLVLRQGFLQKRGKNGTWDAIKQLECIQIDPISVIHPNHHLVLHNRVVDYKPSYLEELLYKDRVAFEYWCNEKSIIPIEDFPYFRYRMQNPTQFHSPFYERIKAQSKELASEIRYVLSEIKKYGPLSSGEFERKGKIKGKLATKVLNLLWDCGDLMISHIDGNRRYYDLTERLLPPNKSKIVASREEYEQFMIRKYMRAYGLVDTRDWRFGWLPLKTYQRKAIIKTMIEEDKLCPIKIEGVKHTYCVLSEYLPLLKNSNAQINQNVLFIAPLDNLLWNRKMVSEIFEFDYAWEVYKVPEKRIYGYYVMPILYGTNFIGRIDPKLDRQNKKMIIHSLLLDEKTFSRRLVKELAGALLRFLKFHNVSQVCIEKTKPKELKNVLTRELS
ncbi:winged helix-turn-helix domain-containing protein [Candidatus Bathyarchaeota archaeon]|nr:winged helix-turn-helix domain-containing protein [Candidatus Bathyarchaeota archaeon]